MDFDKIANGASDDMKLEEAKRFMHDLDPATCNQDASKVASMALRIIQEMPGLQEKMNRLLSEIGQTPINAIQTIMALSLAHDVLLTRSMAGKSNEKKAAMAIEVIARRLAYTSTINDVVQMLERPDNGPGVTTLKSGHGYIYSPGRKIGE